MTQRNIQRRKCWSKCETRINSSYCCERSRIEKNTSWDFRRQIQVLVHRLVRNSNSFLPPSTQNPYNLATIEILMRFLCRHTEWKQTHDKSDQFRFIDVNDTIIGSKVQSSLYYYPIQHRTSHRTPIEYCHLQSNNTNLCNTKNHVIPPDTKQQRDFHDRIKLQKIQFFVCLCFLQMKWQAPVWIW